MRRLAYLLARYGKAIERDLARVYPGTDLAVEWRSRRWRRLLNFIDGLPRHSQFVEAMADDEEAAAAFLDREDQGDDAHQRGPRLSEYTPEREALDAILDRLAEVTNAIVASSGVRPHKAKPAQRPRTATDRLRARRARASHERLVALVLPQNAS